VHDLSAVVKESFSGECFDSGDGDSAVADSFDDLQMAASHILNPAGT
jgi:hypothetical protein